MVTSPYSTYQTAAINTSSPEQLVVMLYDGLLRNLIQARDAFAVSNRDEAKVPLTKTHAIINELAATLDEEAGGELAVNLRNLYDFWARHLLKAQLQADSKAVEDVLSMVRELREAFARATREVIQNRG